MVDQSDRIAVVMAIRPQYVERILAGEKTVEFRKRRFRQEVAYVIMYACSPISRIVGYFTVAGIEEGSPRELWRRHRHAAGVEKRNLFEYFGAGNCGIAIHVGSVVCLKEPIRPERLPGLSSVPQSFAYAKQETISHLLAAEAQ